MISNISIFLQLVTKKSGISNGTYRVRSVFTLTTSIEQTKTITVYST